VLERRQTRHHRSDSIAQAWENLFGVFHHRCQMGQCLDNVLHNWKALGTLRRLVPVELVAGKPLMGRTPRVRVVQAFRALLDCGRTALRARMIASYVLPTSEVGEREMELESSTPCYRI
jgi:hypothetical protein